jgi:hypothetical protein
VEVSASVVLVHFHVAHGISIESDIASYRQQPEDVDMRTYQHNPMEDELGLLLCCDFGPAVIKLILIPTITIHLIQESLCISSLHVQVSSFHGFQLNSHRPGRSCSLEHIILGEEPVCPIS